MGDEAGLPAEPEPERGGVRDDITKELARMFPGERMTRIVERLGLETEDDSQRGRDRMCSA